MARPTMVTAQPDTDGMGRSPTSAPCVACGRSSWVSRYRSVPVEESSETFDILECPGCGLGITWPRPTDLSRYYSAAYYGQRHGPTAWLCNRRRLGIVMRWAGQGSGRNLLDFGCGEGAFLETVERLGWVSWGVERARPESGSAGERVVAELDQLPSSRTFSCVTFWHVLEHLEAPSTTLRSLHKVLAPDGLVLIAVPNFGSWQARATGRFWLHLDLPRHLSHFTPKSVRLLLEASGYEVIGQTFGEWEYDVVGWSQSLLNRFFRGRNAFFKRVSGRPGLGPVLRPRALFQLVMGLGLSATVLGFTWLENLLKRGGTLIVVARPSQPQVSVDAES